MSTQSNLSFHIEQAITLEAPPEKVWRALTTDVAAWWGFHIGPNDSDISLDARVGGHFIERWGDGEGELYATVTFLRAGKKITLEGGMGLAGPGYSKFSYTLEPNGESTNVLLTHYIHGASDPGVEESFKEGWSQLLTKGLTQWVHEGKRAEPA